MSKSNITIISAGAGSGKTYRLTSELVRFLSPKNGFNIRPQGIIATTFTKKAAAELEERVRIRLLDDGLIQEANDLTNAMIGTVHGLGVRLLKRFAFEAGVSPNVEIMAEEDQQVLFNKAIANILTPENIKLMEKTGYNLGFDNTAGSDGKDWRTQLKTITDIARSNAFKKEDLLKSYENSVSSLMEMLPGTEDTRPMTSLYARLDQLLEQSINAIIESKDPRKNTETALNKFKTFRTKIRVNQNLKWHDWMSIGSTAPAKAIKDTVEELHEFSNSHENFKAFRDDLKIFIEQLFDLAIKAIEEFDSYKKRRGLIDYVDMESNINDLLDIPSVQEILGEELDLLMVDEFQDTSPIQLEIFLKLSKLAKHSIWVGDPKQSIYGFRGADPKLMKAILDQYPIEAKNIQKYSWRSREDLVHFSNALFTRAFHYIPEEQIVLEPKRTILDNVEDPNFKAEPVELGVAVEHWFFDWEEGGRAPGSPWKEKALADAISQLLAEGKMVTDRHTGLLRKVEAGDIAILCRSNKQGLGIAEALHSQGLEAAIARNGLLSTKEAALVLACLKYLLFDNDSLSVAEILVLGDGMELEALIRHRLNHVNKEFYKDADWANEFDPIKKLNELRPQIKELSGLEISHLVIETLELRRIIASWGNADQRLNNLDMIRHYIQKYEDACNRMHTAASLGGLLLWLDDLARADKDHQGASENMDAVNVLTYHRSKGLEWPIVFCLSLDNDIKDNPWNVQLMSERHEVDLSNILGDRWIRFWVFPYNPRSSKNPLAQRVKESYIQKAVTAEALREEARLLYVGITRARDFLVLPAMKKKPLKWLNRTFHDGNQDLPVINPDIDLSPFVYKEKIVPLINKPFTYPRIIPAKDRKKSSGEFLEQRIGRQDQTPNLWQLPESKDRVVLQDIKYYGNPFVFPEEVPSKEVVRCLKAFFASDQNEKASTQEAIIEGLLHRLELEDHIEVNAILASAKQYNNAILGLGQAQKEWKQLPITATINEQFFEKVADHIIETENRVYIIQHSGFPGLSKKWKGKARELAPLMLSFKEIWEQQYGTEKKVSILVNFILGAGWMEIG